MRYAKLRFPRGEPRARAERGERGVAHTRRHQGEPRARGAGQSNRGRWKGLSARARSGVLKHCLWRCCARGYPRVRGCGGGSATQAGEATGLSARARSEAVTFAGRSRPLRVIRARGARFPHRSGTGADARVICARGAGDGRSESARGRSGLPARAERGETVLDADPATGYPRARSGVPRSGWSGAFSGVIRARAERGLLCWDLQRSRRVFSPSRRGSVGGCRRAPP